MGGRGQNRIEGGGGGYFPGEALVQSEDFKVGSLGDTVLEEALENTETDLIYQYSALLDAGGVQLCTDPALDSDTLGFVYVRGADGQYGTKVFLNKANFANESWVEKVYADSVASGFHTPGTTASAVLAHEYGHVAHNTLMNRYGAGSTFLGETVTNGNNVVKILVNKAASNANKATGKTRTAKQWASTISGYAKTNSHELIAEAFCDYYTRGKNANTFSVELGKILKKELNR